MLDAEMVHAVDQSAAEFTERYTDAGITLDPATVEYLLSDLIAFGMTLWADDEEDVRLPLFASWYSLFVADALGLDELKALALVFRPPDEIGGA